VPDFRIDEHEILLSTPGQILIEIKIIILPIRADFLIAYSIATCFPLNVESIQAQQRSQLTVFYLLEDIVDFCILFTFFVLQDIAQVVFLTGVDFDCSQVGIYHISVKMKLVFVVYL
jgi:hypothetical protein